MDDLERLETLKRDFDEVAAGSRFLDLIEKVPAAWRQRPAHFHIWLARKLARLTQAQLASKAGIHQSFVARVERGRDVRLSTMQRLYRALGYRMLIVPLKMSSRTFPVSLESQEMNGKT
ncbi:MAG: helix-turn-helix domain-containing protein [Elusimicrobia bacterium]|nr:helix-turn-helix domain-containing protein [Elusimicrobiota bacterium]